MQQITKEELEIQYKKLGSIRALSDYLLIPNSSLRLLLQKFNIKYDKIPARRTKNRFVFDKNELELKYLEFKNINDVAKHYNVSKSTIKKSFKQFGITFNKFIKNKFNENFFHNDTPESFYLAGFIAADGNIHKNSNALRIGLSIKDKDHMEKIKNIISFDGDLKIIKPSISFINGRQINGGEIISLSCSSKNCVNDLKRFNIIPNKSKIYSFPEWLIDHPLVNHFMRGYFDGDGHIGLRNNKTLRWCLVGNIWFLEKFQFILETKCNVVHNNIYKRTETFGQLGYCGNIVVPKICKFLYNNATCYLERKYNIYNTKVINNVLLNKILI